MLVGKPSHPKPLWWAGALMSLGMAGSAAAFIPPPPPQSGVDCNATVYAIDTVVCDDPDLLAMDREVQRETIDAGAEPPESMFFEAHETWFRRRGLCAMVEAARDCVAAAYSERLAIQKALRTNPTPAATEMKCSPPPWNGSVRASITPEWVALLDSKGSVRGIAVPTTKSGWRPVLGILKSGTKKLELRSANGGIRCQKGKMGSR